MKISEMTEDDAKEHLYNAYMGMHSAIANGAEGPHPSKDVSRWRAAAAGAPVEGEIQKGQDDDQPEITERGNAGKTPAMDAALEDARIRNSGHHDITGQLALAAARRSNPAAVRGMVRALGPAYNRLR